MPHSRSELDPYTDPWPREVDTRPGNLGDWPPPPRTPARSGRARHRRRHRGRHRASTATAAADLATEIAPALTGEVPPGVPAPTAVAVPSSAATVGPAGVPFLAVPPLELAPAAPAPVGAEADGAPPETPAEQTRPAGWWRDPRPAEPQHPRARPPVPAAAAAAAATAVERDRRPWLAGTALFVAALVTGTAALASWKHPGEQLPPPDTTSYGATGRLPAASALAGDAQDPRPGGRPAGAAAATHTAATTGGGGAGAATGGDPRIPAVMELAYRGAEARLDATAPDCGLSWSLLAGIGKVESDHAQGGNVDDDGTTREPILGPALDGTDGNAMIADTDRGVLDGDTRWDRAVGPSQFIPTSWDIYGADGNDDARADPNNAYDAAVATGRYLCAGDLHLTDPVDLNTAVFRYNHSQDYVDTVLGWARTYAAGSTGSPPPPGASAAPKQATVIPVPPLPVAPASPALKTPTTPPADGSPASSSTPQAQRRTAASSPTPAPWTSNAEDHAAAPARPRSTPARPSHPMAPPAPRHRAAPPTTSSPTPTESAPTSPALTRRLVPRTTTTTTTPPSTSTTTSPATTTTPPPTTTQASPSPSTDPLGAGAPGCPRPTTVPTPAPGLEPGLPGGALLDDLAGAITLLRDCCNER